ncbi:hypothetical protein O6H91_08G011000 [Diphasiastrum complanatum]|uniref:Uncharacterized protein n=4 Tax=Diphasiastrum complanatum TaxID=34168 RepID=A0ACC2CUZ1_DIPCM|nr:hypothetical protein O6H91_08G011000 [Diphasiastrum complanatum]KAJ7545800.1 hypothetical protein O6H91_08G011000 [Diphasiastrum complanatum]
MEGFFQSVEICDLTLGKPVLHWLPSSTTVADALKALKELNAREISVWDCPPDSDNGSIRSRKHEKLESLRVANGGGERRDPRCVGKLNILDIVCYLATDECLRKYESAILDPVSVLLPSTTNPVKHVDSRTRLCDVFCLILEGAQYLVVPLDSPRNKNLRHTQGSRKLNQVNVKSNVSAAVGLLSRKHQLKSYCWLTQEDVLRFMLGCIGAFSTLPMKSIENLGIINTDVLLVDANAKAITALPLIYQASQFLSAVAVVEGSSTFEHVKDGYLGPKLLGEISISTFKNCDESAALALAAYSVREFLSFAQHGASSKGLKDFAKFRLSQKLELAKLAVNLSSPYLVGVTPDHFSPKAFDSDLWEGSSTDESLGSSCDESFDESSGSLRVLPSKSWSTPRGHAPLITCRPWSSLVAVMAQALAHRTSYVWVTDDDRTLIGIVTYYDMIDALLNHLE